MLCKHKISMQINKCLINIKLNEFILQKVDTSATNKNTLYVMK